MHLSLSLSLEERNYGLSFGWAVAHYIRSGREWSQTLLFPRVAYCRVPSIRLVGGENAYTAQCALPINMLNEKLYVFLWFWIIFLLVMAVGSLVLWLMRTASPFHRHRYMFRFLRVSCSHEDDRQELKDAAMLKRFVDNYLRQDGVFLVRMVAINVGHVIAADVVGVLWKAFRTRTLRELKPPDVSTETSMSVDAVGGGAPQTNSSIRVGEMKPMFNVGFV